MELILKKEQDWYCHSDKKHYFFKETSCGRYFVWIPKHLYADIKSNKELENKGCCLELKRTNLEYCINEEEKVAKFLNQNTDPARRYQGDTEIVAKQKYNDGKRPLFWSYLINSSDYGHLYVLEGIKNSDYGTDASGTIATYNKEFFDAIKYDPDERDKLISDLENLLRESDKNILITVEKCTNTTAIKCLINKIKLEYLFSDATKKLTEEIQKIIPEGSSYLDKELNFRITFNANEKRAYSDVYKQMK